MSGVEHRIAAAGSGTVCVFGSNDLDTQCRNRNSNSRNRQRYGATVIGQDVTTPEPAFQLPVPATKLLTLLTPVF